MANIGSHFREAYEELVHKVTWPTWEELQQTTVIVLVALVIITLIIFGMDFVSERVLKFLYSIIGN